MKATKFFAMVAALLAVSCTNELMDDSIEQNKNYEDGIVLTLTGDAQAEEVESRIIVDGEKSDGKYIVKWRNEDAIGIFSADGTTINNVKAAETTVESGGKAATASFDTEVKVPAESGDELVVYYPYNAATTYANGKFSANVAASQQTNDFTVAYGFSAYTFAYDVATVDAEGGVKFALEHPLAYVKVQVEVTDYVKNWKVRGVQIVDRTGAAKLAGDYTIDTATGELTVTNGTPSVEQYFKNNPTGTVEATSTRYMTLATLPWDFTGSEVWVVAKFEDADGNTIYVPTKYENAKLKAGAWNIIKLNLTADSQSVKSFYEPLDTRQMPGLGYAYGEQNTYLIQCKNGSTYTGGTYTPNADIPSSVKVDIRGRGDFSKIVDLSKVTFEWFKKGVITNGNGTGPVYVPETRAAATSAIDSKAFTIDDSTKAQGYITVTNTGAYAGAPILLMKYDNKVVWSWAFWNIAADGTKLEEVKYGDYTLANMAIGQPTTNMDTWTSTTEVIWHYVHLYQWGRTMPVFVYNDNQYYDALTTTNNNKTVPTLQTVPMTLEQSVQYPVGLITSTALATEQKKWCSEDLYLWGGSEKNEARVGVKTVFDPCPKGWRVMDVAVANYMRDNATAAYTSTAAVIGSSLTAGGTSSYWIIAGRLDGKLANANYVTRDTVGKYWTNYLEGGGNTASAGYVLTVNKSNSKPTRNTHPRSTAMAVRCQKDTDNR
ncbi:MAG: hypothetical protein IKB18_06640 [Tidjanibacter sp.]|nr:hypothetical protein [Tidjanibacter sp.]